ncbi:MAG: hypothetical protein HQL40_01265 [Alphaproteobacteria bacterium]|nr:hypothetical protein [Alphaproteobacteria bacterium]
MRCIRKGDSPEALIKWKFANRTTPENLVYGGGQFPSASILQHLVREQRGICAYTMLRITPSTSHIEHLKPQSECNRTDAERTAAGQEPLREDIFWKNMLGCHPESNSAKAKFGAHIKDDWWDQTKFVSPLREDCESRITFDRDGVAKGADDHANKTIDVLSLNHPTLVEMRAGAIKMAGVHPRSGSPLRAAQTARLIAAYKNYQGENLPEFVQAIIHAAEQHLVWLEKVSRRNSA